ncbi:quinol oxidase subunit 4 [Sphingobacterium sp. N143]|uniref:quinol oxidase subunit 4 n=1 Tax=Sphingobacterium sp. N143 TaxID=2746727 RepID=UPI0025753E7B|nr:quinol oxidase subunit 4 [Sphingobacterium sp. N143]MDM1296026.1 quinol oxidase subunit 4 [Sphingobacterium sp. N143]
MKRTLLLFFSVFMIISMSSCYSTHRGYGHRHHHKHGKGMPPGQAKKYYGKQSARDFAPGQQKKHRH